MSISSIYQPAIEVIKEHYHKNNQNHPLNKHQLEGILHEAFKHLQNENNFSKKDWMQGSVPTPTHKQQLINTVTSFVINTENPWKPNLTFNNEFQNLFFRVLRGNQIPSKQLLNIRILKAVLFKKNHEFLDDSKNLIRTAFKDIHRELSRNSWPAEAVFHYEVIIGDLLALLPFLSPSIDESFEIPIKVKNQWVLAEYTTETIQLTKNWMGSPLMAYGLNPKSTSHPPILLFKGTTYPADDGFIKSLLTDGNIGAAVGEYAFKIGKKAIKEWLDKHPTNQDNKAVIYGKSLGGALSWMSALHFPNQIGKVMVYGAPGFYPKDEKKLKELLANQQAVPEINMFWQKNDPVPYVDKAPHQGINYFQIISGRNRKGVLAHADMFSLHERSSIIKLDMAKHGEKWLRIKQTLLRTMASFLLFPLIFSFYVIFNLSKQVINLCKYSFKKISNKIGYNVFSLTH